jgi:hypothetical protein
MVADDSSIGDLEVDGETVNFVKDDIDSEHKLDTIPKNVECGNILIPRLWFSSKWNNKLSTSLKDLFKQFRYKLGRDGHEMKTRERNVVRILRYLGIHSVATSFRGMLLMPIVNSGPNNPITVACGDQISVISDIAAVIGYCVSEFKAGRTDGDIEIPEPHSLMTYGISILNGVPDGKREESPKPFSLSKFNGNDVDWYKWRQGAEAKMQTFDMLSVVQDDDTARERPKADAMLYGALFEAIKDGESPIAYQVQAEGSYSGREIWKRLEHYHENPKLIHLLLTRLEADLAKLTLNLRNPGWDKFLKDFFYYKVRIDGLHERARATNTTLTGHANFDWNKKLIEKFPANEPVLAGIKSTVVNMTLEESIVEIKKELSEARLINPASPKKNGNAPGSEKKDTKNNDPRASPKGGKKPEEKKKGVKDNKDKDEDEDADDVYKPKGKNKGFKKKNPFSNSKKEDKGETKEKRRKTTHEPVVDEAIKAMLGHDSDSD